MSERTEELQDKIEEENDPDDIMSISWRCLVKQN